MLQTVRQSGRAYLGGTVERGACRWSSGVDELYTRHCAAYRQPLRHALTALTATTPVGCTLSGLAAGASLIATFALMLWTFTAAWLNDVFPGGKGHYSRRKFSQPVELFLTLVASQ